MIKEIKQFFNKNKKRISVNGCGNEINNNDELLIDSKYSKINIVGNGNKVNFKNLNKASGFISIQIVGNNNKVDFSDLSDMRGNIAIKIYGNDTIIDLKKIVVVKQLGLSIAQPKHPYTGNDRSANNCKIFIDENTSFAETNIVLWQSNSDVSIGKDCMFSSNVQIFNSDGHPILDLNTGELINKPKSLIIGDHCWICHSAVILKNSIIPDGCIVGRNAIVSKKFNEKNVVIAGNPAKVVKKDIRWERTHEEFYVNNY